MHPASKLIADCTVMAAKYSYSLRLLYVDPVLDADRRLPKMLTNGHLRVIGPAVNGVVTRRPKNRAPADDDVVQRRAGLGRQRKCRLFGSRRVVVESRCVHQLPVQRIAGRRPEETRDCFRLRRISTATTTYILMNAIFYGCEQFIFILFYIFLDRIVLVVVLRLPGHLLHAAAAAAAAASTVREILIIS
jgi:hypothetical protein